MTCDTKSKCGTLRLHGKPAPRAPRLNHAPQPSHLGYWYTLPYLTDLLLNSTYEGVRSSVTDKQLAAELRQIAAHPYADNRSRQLRELASAVIESDQLLSGQPAHQTSLWDPPQDGTTGKAEYWCEVDLFAAFAPEDTFLATKKPDATVKRPNRRFPGKRAAVGSVLVFVPILITWLGLKMATTAYGELLEADGPEVARRPFLELWQQGFDGRLFWLFTFDNVALLTVLMISTLLVWTLWETISRHQSADRTEAETDIADEELARLRIRLRAALTEATLVLSQVRLSSPVRFAAELTKAVAEVERIAATTRRAQTDLNHALTVALQSAGKMSDALVAGATDVRGAVAALDQHLTGLRTTCADMTAAVKQSTAVIETTGTKAERALTAAGDQLATAVTKSTTDLGEAVGGHLTRSTRSIETVIAGLDTRVAALDPHLTALAARIGDLDVRVAALGTSAGQFFQAAGRIEAAVEEAQQAVSTSTTKAAELFGRQMDTTLTSTAADFRRTFGDTSADIRDAYTTTGMQIREALGDWSFTATAHVDRIETASDTAGRTASKLEETRDVLDRLPAALERMLADLPTRMKSLTDGEFTELRHAISDLRVTFGDAARSFATAVPSAPFSRVVPEALQDAPEVTVVPADGRP